MPKPPRPISFLGWNPPVAALIVSKWYVGHSPLMMSSNMIAENREGSYMTWALEEEAISDYPSETHQGLSPSLLRRTFLQIRKPSQSRSNTNPIITVVMIATNFLVFGDAGAVSASELNAWKLRDPWVRVSCIDHNVSAWDVCPGRRLIRTQQWLNISFCALS